jgi:chromosome segregation ATPase
MSTDPALLAALQAAHNLEATASEMWHKQEHQFKNALTRYPKLGKWFDRRHKEAYQRQHDIRKHMMRLGGIVDTELGDTSYTDDVKQALQQACKSIDELSAAHEAVNQAAKAAGDKGTREKFHGYAHDLQKLRQRSEQKLQQLEDLGLPTFLSKHL